MTATGDARQAGGGATAHLKAPVRYALAVGLLVVGIGDLWAIDGVLLPRYLGGTTSVGELLGTQLDSTAMVAVSPPGAVASPVPAVLPPASQTVAEVAMVEAAVPEVAEAIPQVAQAAQVPTSPDPAPIPAAGSEPEPASANPAGPEFPEFPHLRFARNTTWLSPAAKETLGRLVAILGEQPSRRAVLSGHTDRIGPEELNRALSLERARRCVRWLAARGIDPTRIEIHGFGSTHPLEVDVSAEAQARNRRVEIDLR